MRPPRLSGTEILLRILAGNRRRNRAGLCSRHAAQRKDKKQDADVAATLTGEPGSFQSAEGINQSLAKLYNHLAQNRVTPRHAAVLAYISSLLLRTLPAIEHELNPYDFMPSSIFDDHDPSPSPPHDQAHE